MAIVPGGLSRYTEGELWLEGARGWVGRPPIRAIVLHEKGAAMDILLACARPDLRFALEVLLREQPGLAVTGTATGSEGLLALAESTCPDLVIVDWDLPGRPPAEVLALASDLDCRPYLLILGRDASVQQTALAAGADAFVLQGDPPHELLATVQQARSQRTTVAGIAVNPAQTDMEGDRSPSAETTGSPASPHG